MAGLIILSSSGDERRTAWWSHFRQADPKWQLAVPSASQVELVRRSFPFWATTFERVTTLDAVAERLARQSGLLEADHAMSEQDVITELGPGDETELVAHAILGWQRGGFATPAELPELMRLAVAAKAWAELEAQRGGPVTTAAWCALSYARSGQTANEPLPNLYLERFQTASHAEIELLDALAGQCQVAVRLRDLVDVPPIEAPLQAMVEALASGGGWSVQIDDPPADALERQALASHLFASESPPPRPSGLGPKTVEVIASDSLVAELAAIQDAVAARVADGALASGIAVALPDGDPYRHAELALPEYALRLTHADLASWAGTDLYLAGLDGVLAPRAAGTEGDEELSMLPTHLLDAVENTRGVLTLTARGPWAPNVREAITRLTAV